MEYEFMECESCSEKPGSPILCRGCINNRSAISRLTYKVEDFSKIDSGSPVLDRIFYHAAPSIKEALTKQMEFRAVGIDSTLKYKYDPLDSKIIITVTPDKSSVEQYKKRIAKLLEEQT